MNTISIIISFFADLEFFLKHLLVVKDNIIQEEEDVTATDVTDVQEMKLQLPFYIRILFRIRAEVNEDHNHEDSLKEFCSANYHQLKFKV